MQTKLLKLSLTIIFPVLTIGCGNKSPSDSPPPSHGHQEVPPVLPPAPKEDLRCAGVKYSTYTVVITNSWMNREQREKSYSPSVLKIKVCDKVVWERQDDRSRASAMYHTSTSTDTFSANKFDTGAILYGAKSVPIQFFNPGESPYFCAPHHWMRGIVVVEPR